MYPKMMSEVIEAIETHFCDEPDIMVDCMLYLMNANARVEDVHRIERWFDEHGLCPKCGTKIKYQQVKEYHSEVDAYETLYEPYCPHCGPHCDRGE